MLNTVYGFLDACIASSIAGCVLGALVGRWRARSVVQRCYGGTSR